MLNVDEKQSILRETVFNYLSFNYTEHVARDFSGTLVLSQSITGDLDYKELFGNHTTEKVAIYESAFSFANSMSELLPDPGGKVGVGKNVLTGIDIIKNVQEGEYEKAKINAVKAGAEIGISYGVKVAADKFLLPAVAEGFANAGTQTFINVLTPLEAGNGSTITGNRAATKNIESENYKHTVISSLLFYFMNGNKLEFKDNINTIRNLQKENSAPKDNTSIQK